MRRLPPSIAVLPGSWMFPDARTGHYQTHLQRQIDATDRQIDKLVYELYGQTDEEIAVVEGKL